MAAQTQTEGSQYKESRDAERERNRIAARENPIIYGAGAGENEDIGGMAGDIGKGAAVGATIAGAGKALSPVAKYAGNKMKDVSTDLGRRSLGFTKRFLGKEGVDKLNQATRTLLKKFSLG